MKSKYFLLLALFFTACSLSTDPEASLAGISGVPYDNFEKALTIDSVKLQWKSKFTPVKISLYNNSEILLSEVQFPDSKIKQVSDSLWIARVGGLKPKNNYKWQVSVKDEKNKVLKGPLWSFQFLPGGIVKGRVLKFVNKKITLPHNVNVYFNVYDLYNIGDTTKTRSNFSISDDGTKPLDKEYVWDVKRVNPQLYTKIVLMLDASYSVKSSPEFAKMKQEAAEFVYKFLTTKSGLKEIELWKFSDKPEKLTNFTSDKTELVTAINAINDKTRSTNLYGAVVTGTESFENVVSKDKVVKTLIVIFTDGNDTQGSRTLGDALKAIKNKNIILVNTDESEQYKYYLNELTTFLSYLKNEHTKILDFVNNFHNKTELVSKSMYRLIYFSPKRGNKNHELKIILKNSGFQNGGAILNVNYASDGFY